MTTVMCIEGPVAFCYSNTVDENAMRVILSVPQESINGWAISRCCLYERQHRGFQ